MHIVFLDLFLFAFLLLVLMYSIFLVYPALFRAWSCAAWLKMSSLDDRVEIRLAIVSGILLVIDGGWLDELLTYTGSSFDFLKGLCVPDAKSKLTSRKFTFFRLDSTVILSPQSWNILVIAFLARSAVLPEADFIT